MLLTTPISYPAILGSVSIGVLGARSSMRLTSVSRVFVIVWLISFSSRLF